MMRRLLSVMSTVVPAGAARATASLAMTVPAPGRFSITIVAPWVRPIWSPTMRARVSTPPPGAYGTAILRVRVAWHHAEWPDSVTRMTATAGIALLSGRMLIVAFIELMITEPVRGMGVPHSMVL